MKTTGAQLKCSAGFFAALLTGVLAFANTFGATQASTPAQPDAPGMACFGAFGYGLTCLTEKGWQNYSKAGKQIGSDQIAALAQCPDGRLLVAHTMGVHMFNGKKWAST